MIKHFSTLSSANISASGKSLICRRWSGQKRFRPRFPSGRSAHRCRGPPI